MSLKEYIDNYFVDTSKRNLGITNFFKFVDTTPHHREAALRLEEKVLIMSGLHPGKDVFIYDVPINYGGQNYIHTVECGRKNKDILILLHGYSGSLILFCPLLKDLSRRFRIFCIDFLGMGLSSRPDFKCTNPERTIQYFVESCEKWRKAMKIKKYYLGGHSFGGYIAAAWPYKNKKGVKGLYLMSPTGVSDSDDNQVPEEWAQALGWAKKNFWLTYFQLYTRLYNGRSTPAGLVRSYPYLGRIFIKKYMIGLIGQNHPSQYGELIGEFLYHMLMIPGGSEQAVHYVLRPPRLCAHIPLEKVVLEDLGDIPIYCYFGESDWNDWTGAYRFAQVPQNRNFKFEWITESGHQMTLQNPSQLTEKMLLTLEDGSPKSRINKPNHQI